MSDNLPVDMVIENFDIDDQYETLFFYHELFYDDFLCTFMPFR